MQWIRYEMDDHRRRVLAFITLFASTDAIERVIGSSVPEEVADRLCRLWIDEIYIPGIRYRDGLKGDRALDEVNRFLSSFSDRERYLLEQFHRFLELRLQMLPKRLPTERAFPRGAFWQSIIQHARRVLEEIDPERLEVDELLDPSARRVAPQRPSQPLVGPETGAEKNGQKGEN